MNIVMISDPEQLQAVAQRHILLELDTVVSADTGQPQRYHCLIEDPVTQDLLEARQWTQLHADLIRNYRLRNWNYCREAIDHLRGRWSGSVDSFYDELVDRIDRFEIQDPGPDWDWVIRQPT